MTIERTMLEVELNGKTRVWVIKKSVDEIDVGRTVTCGVPYPAKYCEVGDTFETKFRTKAKQ
jgi:hypothetical protein